MDTFDDLMQPFPLFKAPIAHAWFDEPGMCSCCKQHAELRFSGACYDCFRTGEIDFTIGTELGMVTGEYAREGRTHGLPLNDPAELGDYELTPYPIDPRFPDERWYQVHVKSDYLIELLRTPKYHTWQGENWLFCCKRPMVFRGLMPADIFKGDVEQLPLEMMNFLQNPDWKITIEGGHSSHTYYVFTCDVCGRLRFHDDAD